MRILIVEDDPNKVAALVSTLNEIDPKYTLQFARSYRSGLEQAIQNAPDVVLLDMTLPTWDVAPNEAGGRTRPYAGRELLFELRRRKIQTKVVVVTQYESFGEGPDRKTLEQLGDELRGEYAGMYFGAVFYQAANSGWKKRLEKLLQRTEES